MKKMMVKIETLLDTRPDEIPKESQFLLEFNHGNLAQSNIHAKTYWVVTREAAIRAGQTAAATGARGGRIHNKHRIISEAEERTRLDRFTYGSISGERPPGSLRRQTVIKPLSREQGSNYASIIANLRSSIQYNPSD